MHLRSGFAAYAISASLGRLLSLFVLPFLTAYLSPAEVGELTMLAFLALFASTAAALGVTTGLGTSYHRCPTPQGRSEVVGSATLFLAATALACLILGFCFAAPLSRAIGGLEVRDYRVVLTLLGAALGLAAQPPLLVLQFEGRAWSNALATLTTATATAALTCAAVWLGYGVDGVLAAQVAAAAAGLLLALWLSPVRPGLSMPGLGMLLRDALPFLPGLIALLVVQHGSKLILQHSHGSAAVGLYGLATNIGLAMAVVITAFQQTWFPVFMRYRQDPAAGNTVFAHVALGLGALGGMGCVGFAVFAEPVVRMLTSPAFHDAWPYVAPTAAMQWLTGWFSLLLPGFYFADRVALVARLQILSAVATIGLGALLIPLWGLWGCVGAGLGGTAVMLAATLIELRWNRLFIPATPLPALLVILAVGIGGIALGYLPGLTLPLRCLVFAVCGAAMAIALRVMLGRAWTAPLAILFTMDRTSQT